MRKLSKYIFTRGSFREINSDELMHWKYFKREKVNGKWRYWYDIDSLKKDLKSAVNKVTNKSRSIVSSGKKTVSKYTSSIKTTVGKISDEAKNIINSAKKNAHKYIAKVPTDGDTYRYFYSDKAYQAYLKGKNAVDKALDINATPSDVAKANAKNLLSNTLFGSFGKAVYNAVAPAFTAIQVALTTPKSFSELKKIDKEQSNDDHQKTINPDFDRTIYDRAMNCTFCSSAYDLRKRGYDVEANPISMCEAYTIDDIRSWYKNAKVVSQQDVVLETDPNKAASDAKRLEVSLKKNGEGSRGHLILYWPDGGGHDVIWEVENNEVVIRDCQSGEVNNTMSILEPAIDYEYIRTDNLEPTEEILRTVRNRKSR